MLKSMLQKTKEIRKNKILNLQVSSNKVLHLNNHMDS